MLSVGKTLNARPGQGNRECSLEDGAATYFSMVGGLLGNKALHLLRGGVMNFAGFLADQCRSRSVATALSVALCLGVLSGCSGPSEQQEQVLRIIARGVAGDLWMATLPKAVPLAMRWVPPTRFVMDPIKGKTRARLRCSDNWDLACFSALNPDEFIRRFLRCVSQCRVGSRPGRFEPRCVKRRRDQYQLMVEPRNQLRHRLSKGDNSFE